MTKRVTLGGDRLGSGKRQKVELHGFERSTHDLGYTWRNTQAPGTLVPFMVQLALPGDTFDIDLQADVKTHPTLGPLFASFKLQLDIFECPIRLYHSWLHNNKLKIGNDMSKVKLPQLEISANKLIFKNYRTGVEPVDLQQINPSSLLSYLGIRGLGKVGGTSDVRNFNAIPYLGYYDIVKNYYSNKQEEIGMFINAKSKTYLYSNLVINDGTPHEFTRTYNLDFDLPADTNATGTVTWYGEDEPLFLVLIMADSNEPNNHGRFSMPADQFISKIKGMADEWEITFPIHFDAVKDGILWGISVNGHDIDYELTPKQIFIDTFPLENIDTMRDNILSHNNNSPFVINKQTSLSPYVDNVSELKIPYAMGQITSYMSQQGLCLKTYQSDIFNNWLNTEWLDGEGGINDITAVDTSSGSFDINTLNLAQKVYNMLNRIAVSGGTYEDWLEAVYDHESFRRCETPMYHGGLSKEIVFQEVISTSETYKINLDEAGTEPIGRYGPLGTMAGRGILSNKHKGGKVTIKVNEPSYIIGIVSITPRIDYYQGNEFFVNHTTMNDLHKPNLDEIGFQDLVTDKMAFWDTSVAGNSCTFNSAGKQPAWLDYMTNYNKVYGNFADERNEMFMTLTRRYQPDIDTEQIQDLTTYIDPTKYNYAFAQTDITAQNFWVQIGVDMIARRKMSAKIMPNL